MLSHMVRVANVTDLEAGCVLQIVARLVAGEAGHDGRPVGNAHDDCEETGCCM